MSRGKTVLLKAAFAVYAVSLFVGTHWPNLKIKVGEIKRPDLIIHLCVFGTWAVLLWMSGFVGPRDSVRTGVRVWLIGVAYAAFDEGTQAIPWVHRTAGWDDYGADVLGITLGTVAAMGIVKARGVWRRA